MYGTLKWSLTDALDDAEFRALWRDGLWLEFGVWNGMSANVTARYLAQVPGVATVLDGFDTFTGLPERWRNFPMGSFSWRRDFPGRGLLPPVHARVRLHEGLFRETLPRFLASRPERQPVAWASIDCDLESGARDALAPLGLRLRPGTRLHFHELLCPVRCAAGSPEPSDEARALHAWLQTLGPGVEFELLPVTSSWQESAVLVVRAASGTGSFR